MGPISTCAEHHPSLRSASTEEDMQRLRVELEVVHREAVGGDSLIRDMEKRLVTLLSSSPIPEHRRLLKELMVTYHPDKNSREGATHVFQYINNVRSALDATLHLRVEQFDTNY